MRRASARCSHGLPGPAATVSRGPATRVAGTGCYESLAPCFKLPAVQVCLPAALRLAVCPLLGPAAVTVTGSCPGPVTRARAGAADRRLLSPCGDPSESDLQGSQLASEVAAGAGRSSPPGLDRRRAARAAGRCNLRLSAASHTGIPTELLPTEPESAQPESRCHSHGVPGPGLLVSRSVHGFLGLQLELEVSR
jgi:hypothetical protein